jgi:uncharacterized membrane protein YeiH
VIPQLSAYVQKEHFDVPGYIHLAAILFFSMTGALAAMRRGYDLVGVFTLAFVVGTGGGLLRDGLFLQQGPPLVTRDWRFVPAVLAACIIAWLTSRWAARFQKLMPILDAVGLSLYSIVGVFEALRASLSGPAAVLVGVVNAVGGGLLRDILTREEPLMLKPGQFYVLASLGGCLVFCGLIYAPTVPVHQAAIIAIVSTFVFRILAIVFNWQTTPMNSWLTVQQPLSNSTTTTTTTTATSSPPEAPPETK